MSNASNPNQGGPGQSYQDNLINYCRSQGLRPPIFQIVSDRRGGRTAWSCVVTIQGTQYPARFWYDGQFVNNSKEDASEKALQMLGVIQGPPAQQQAPYTQPRQQPSGQSQQSGGQFYGAISG